MIVPWEKGKQPSKAEQQALKRQRPEARHRPASVTVPLRTAVQRDALAAMLEELRGRKLASGKEVRTQADAILCALEQSAVPEALRPKPVSADWEAEAEVVAKAEAEAEAGAEVEPSLEARIAALDRSGI